MGDTLSNREDALLDGHDYDTSTTFDALNRPKKLTMPSDDAEERKELVPTYNRAGAVESVDLDGTTYIDRIAYNARGQRLFTALGNGTMTRYAYDPETFRVRRMRSREYTKSGTTYSETGTKFQDSGYHYDLAGNILCLIDKSAIGEQIDNTAPALDGYPYGTPTMTFFREYTYEPVGRLATADGAEHDNRWSAPADPEKPWEDWFIASATTDAKLFTETYDWDANGNLLELVHTGNTNSYTRDYTMTSGTNRLDQMTVGSSTSSYTFDPAGNMTQENTARHFTWDHADRLHTYRTQTSGSQASVFSHYLYDASGQRVMQVVTKGTTSVVTTYVDGVFDHCEERSGTTTITESNDEIHVFDGDRRAARLRVGTAFEPAKEPGAEIYFLDDHLRSTRFTLESDATVFSREEYSPFGESTFGSWERKRYRFGGKEKDDGSGLNYHGARYLAPWLGRWTSADPSGMVDGPNVYGYARGNPIGGRDPTGTQTSSSGGSAWPGPTEAQDAARHVSGVARETATATQKANAGASAQAAVSTATDVADQTAAHGDSIGRIVREPNSVSQRHPLHPDNWSRLAELRNKVAQIPERQTAAETLKSRLLLDPEEASARVKQQYELLRGQNTKAIADDLFGDALASIPRERLRAPTQTELERTGKLVNLAVEEATLDWVLGASAAELSSIEESFRTIEIELFERASGRISVLRQDPAVLDTPSAAAAGHYLVGAGLIPSTYRDWFGAGLGEATLPVVGPVQIEVYDRLKSSLAPGAPRTSAKPASVPWLWTRAWAFEGLGATVGRTR